MFWSNAAFKLERQERLHREELERAVAEAKREAKVAIIKKDDQIAELKAELSHYLAKEYKIAALVEHEHTLAVRRAELDHDRELLEVQEELFEGRKKAHNADMEHRHEETNQLQKDAEEYRAKAKSELSDAKSESRKAGYAEGYVAGLKEGVAIPTALVREERQAHQQVLNTAILTSAVQRTVGTDPKKDEAYQKLAESVSTNFATLAGKVMADNKTVIIKD